MSLVGIGGNSVAQPQLRVLDPAMDGDGSPLQQVALTTMQQIGRGDGAGGAKHIPVTKIAVKPGDTLQSLAQEYGTTIGQLAQVNPHLHDLNLLRVGDRLNVPLNRQVIEVRPGETLSQLAHRYGIPVDQLAKANGIADPNAILAGQRYAAVPAHAFGLDRESQVRAYIKDVLPLEKSWGSLTPSQRLARIGDALNARLRAAGIPPVRVTVGSLGGANGVYQFATHSIAVDPTILSQSKISDGQLRDLADTLYHEGRHASQWFDMARLQIARGQDPSKLGLPAGVIDAARHAPPLDPKSERGRFIGAMYESVYGAGAAHRNATLNALGLPHITHDQYEQYRALPEEADAWRVGGKVDTLWPRS